MKWILILTLWNTESASISMQEFHQKEMCENAAQVWLKDIGGLFSRKSAICVSQ